eukprot:CAMPEP_0115886836 /NCGR_PEP_ID=MMETSP0287-20121206/31428_1 /TAXON_ID=412157 /ORGANISM="Chrysochromulina rotalis, Strain UIO044" /LENGTH=85 /DNA_ID=CAMNT_0003343363 /DNA_START=32 /DNA_END=286 /DNA_ORIENTATION=-
MSYRMLPLPQLGMAESLMASSLRDAHQRPVHFSADKHTILEQKQRTATDPQRVDDAQWKERSIDVPTRSALYYIAWKEPRHSNDW